MTAPTKSPSKVSIGYIPPAGTFTARAFCSTIGWCRRAYRQAKRAGLRVTKFGNKEYIRGADADEFFARLAGEQTGGQGQ